MWESLKVFRCGTRELGEKGESREVDVKDESGCVSLSNVSVDSKTNGNMLMATESGKDMDI